jgi:Fic family protein
MDLRKFKSGAYKQQFQYKSFSPTLVDHLWLWSDPKINTLLAEANLKLGELNAFSLYAPDIDIFIRMHVIKEATTSSRIEGTKTDMEEALLKESEVLPDKKDDWQEVQNYINAMNFAIEKLATVPLSTRLLKETHRRLMYVVRGETKLPGEYRTSQNWIGGATIKDAVFIPPHHTEVAALMGDLEKFLHNEQIDVPHLIRIAIAHYQFETIHPFLDGNGRLGRLLITLYLSEYFERHKSLYYDNLMLVRTANNMSQWIKFFLVAIIETSKKGIATFQHILKLKERIEGEKILTLGKKVANAKALMNFLYKTPQVTAADVAEALHISPATANALIQDFISLGILMELTGQRRNRLFLFQEYVKLFSDKS